MIIGIPKEIKGDETRVAILPSGVNSFVTNGHMVIIENGAGLASGISDENYLKSGAKIVRSIVDIYESAELILKVKEPILEEYEYLKEGHILLGYSNET